jgi:hypothetical protein
VGAEQEGANFHDEMAKGISKIRYKRSRLFQSFWRSLYAILTISPNERMEPRNGGLYTLTGKHHES